MTEHHPDSAAARAPAHAHDYLPAAGLHALLPGYDMLTRLLGMWRNYDTLVAQADLSDGLRVLEIGCGTGNVTLHAKRCGKLCNPVDVGRLARGEEPGTSGAVECRQLSVVDELRRSHDCDLRLSRRVRGVCCGRQCSARSGLATRQPDDLRLIGNRCRGVRIATRREPESNNSSGKNKTL